MRSTIILGEKVYYKVQHSKKAKIPRVDISIHGLKVVIPEGFEKDPESLLIEKAVKILEKKHEFDEYRKKLPNRQFREGEYFPYLGKDHSVVLSEKATKHYIDEDKIVLSNKVVSKSSIKEELRKFYTEKAKEIINKKLEKFSIRLGVNYNGVRFKNQRTRWASCSTSKNLNFNWRLVMAPESIIDYIVVHELIHLEEGNHSKRFWLKISNVFPDYKERIKWLNENSPRLIFSDYDLKYNKL